MYSLVHKELNFFSRLSAMVSDINYYILLFLTVRNSVMTLNGKNKDFKLLTTLKSVGFVPDTFVFFFVFFFCQQRRPMATAVVFAQI